jgi:malonate transporter and related proteins
MLEVINLALPFFGLIFLGLGCGKFKAIPDAGLAWMDFFILYVALPALFYRIVAQTPLEQWLIHDLSWLRCSRPFLRSRCRLPWA